MTAGCIFSPATDEETYDVSGWDGQLQLFDVLVSASPCGIQQIAVGPNEQQFTSLFVDNVTLGTTDCPI